jgi:hypothetical protein
VGQEEIKLFLLNERKSGNDKYFSAKEIKEKVNGNSNTHKYLWCLCNRNILESRIATKPLRHEFRFNKNV